MTDIRSYLMLARETGAFEDIEIEILREILEAWEKSPEKDYTLIEIRDGHKVAGFAVYGPVPMTDFSYDIYWIVVDHALQGKGVGHQLMGLIESTVLKANEKAILRIETSGKKEYAYQQRFYQSCGYMLIGRIADFYEPGDDFLMYAKHIAEETPKAREGK
jgi:ribosomal protein S18 acetylase RimI-like enzyme